MSLIELEPGLLMRSVFSWSEIYSGSKVWRAHRTFSVQLCRAYDQQQLTQSLKIKQRLKKEPHSRDGTSCADLTIPYGSDFMWDCVHMGLCA